MFRYQVNGRTREMSLGNFKTFGLRDARDRATSCRRLLADGIDPIDQRNAAMQKKRLTDARAATDPQSGILHLHQSTPNALNTASTGSE
ncbi:Arm DNA-binding domain-containing protein [Rhodanobacter soli]|uniref:Arm DNA-binding domain-containing protein n=1 Tax=Rhodanobacter soli TaxID=590609 RepID=UPI003CD0A9A0